jgi:hypothetical protein
MKTVILSILTLAATASALVARGENCCFHLTASGGASGSIGQLSDGQNRIGGGLPVAQYCIDSNGALTDQANRGCILTRKLDISQDLCLFRSDTSVVY